MNRPFRCSRYGIAVLIFCFSLVLSESMMAQVSYGSASAYGLRKIYPSYSGKAVNVRRTCDNATKDIGFTSCGDIDTAALKLFVVASNPLSAITATSAAAFSLRRLTCSYAGKAIKVRRSSDNTTQDIGFTTWGDLDTTSLLTFVGSGSGFVTTWYDQSGNGRNATQATTGSQPRIVNAGVIDRQNSQPAVRYLGMGYNLSTASFTAFAGGACFNGVAAVSTNVSYNAIVNKCQANIPAPLDFYNAQNVIGNGTTYTFSAATTGFTSALPLGIWTYQSTSAGAFTCYHNQSANGSGTATSYGDAGTPLVIGSRIDLVTGLNGWISEVVTFSTMPTTTERQFLEWSQSQYYSISGPILNPIPPGAASGYINTWYDQSGSANNAVQATTANQPRIVNTGVVELNGTKPALKFGGTFQNLVAPVPVSAYPSSISLLVNTSGASTNGAFVKVGGIVTGTAGYGIGIGASGTTFDNSGTSLIGLKEWAVWCPSNPVVNCPSTPFTSTTVQMDVAGGSGLTTYLNGTNVPLNIYTTATNGTTIAGSLYIGGYTNVTNRFPVVKESEVAVFGTALGTTRRTLIESNQASYFNLAISNSKYTPPTTTSYILYVNGVGRESSTDSVAGTRSSSGMGFSVGTAATDYLKDNGDYMTCGIDCPAPSVSTTFLPATVIGRWTNDWYLNKTDVNSNGGNITIYFDFADYGVTGSPGVASNYVLLTRSNTASNFAIVATVTSTTVAGSRVKFLIDAANLVNNNYYTIGTLDATQSPLPVELLDFTANVCGEEVCLNWSTASETNNNYFTVERATEAESWSDLLRVNGAGTSSSYHAYSGIDYHPYPNTSYYRLRQTDFNGNISHSNPVPVNFPHKSNLNIYPNPANSLVYLNTDDPTADQITLEIYDVLGKLVRDKEQISIQKNPVVNISGLPAGVYYLKCDFNGSQQIRKLVISRD